MKRQKIKRGASQTYDTPSYFLIRFTTQTKGSHRMILDNQFTSKKSFLSCRSNSFDLYG